MLSAPPPRFRSRCEGHYFFPRAWKPVPQRGSAIRRTLRAGLPVLRDRGLRLLLSLVASRQSTPEHHFADATPQRGGSPGSGLTEVDQATAFPRRAGLLAPTSNCRAVGSGRLDTPHSTPTCTCVPLRQMLASGIALQEPEGHDDVRARPHDMPVDKYRVPGHDTSSMRSLTGQGRPPERPRHDLGPRARLLRPEFAHQ